MTRRLLCSLLLIVTAASLSSGAIWQPLPQQPAPQATISAEEAALIAQVMFDEDPDPCPDLTDPYAETNRYACELLARLRYDLGITTCSEYVEEWMDCQGIPDLLVHPGTLEEIINPVGQNPDHFSDS